ncbi:MAG TPA: glycosyltransferase family 39 protein [Candidatus Kapabacteria bacterium]|nr:glycosyltransferase family 39 protein [Candidatus Kapabacteria bacterium]
MPNPLPAESLHSETFNPVDPDAPGAFGRRGWLWTAAVLAAIALPTLLLPLSHDQSFFFVTAQRMIRGAVLYRDLVDIKPPLLYHMYALAALFGDSGISVRILDLVLQGVTCWLMIALVRRSGGGDRIAALAAAIFLVCYYGQGYGDTAQCEGFAGLLGFGTAWMIMYRRTAAGFFSAGLLLGAIVMMKFPMGLLLPAVIVLDLTAFVETWSGRARLYGWLLGGFCIVLAAFALFLTMNNAWHSYRLIMEFTSAYAAIETHSPGTWIRNLLTMVPLHLALDYSLLLVAATCAGLLYTVRAAPGEAGAARNASFVLLLRFNALAFVALLLSIIVEAKYPGYHFERLYPFGAPLAAAGLAAARTWLARRQSRTVYRRLLAPALVCGMVLFGPLPRYVWHSLIPAAQAVQGIDPAPDGLHAFARRLGAGTYPHADGTTTPRRLRQGDLFVMSSQAALIYLHAGLLPENNVYMSAYIQAPFASQEWKDETGRFLLEHRPRVIVLDRGDALPGISGTELTSLDAMRALPGVAAMLDSDYVRVWELENAQGARPVVYERKGS